MIAGYTIILLSYLYPKLQIMTGVLQIWKNPMKLYHIFDALCFQSFFCRFFCNDFPLGNSPYLGRATWRCKENCPATRTARRTSEPCRHAMQCHATTATPEGSAVEQWNSCGWCFTLFHYSCWDLGLYCNFGLNHSILFLLYGNTT